MGLRHKKNPLKGFFFAANFQTALKWKLGFVEEAPQKNPPILLQKLEAGLSLYNARARTRDTVGFP